MKNIKESPWLGLVSYEEKDSTLFYGRTQEIQELSGDIFNNTQTVVYGPSGTGKTSLLKAGIFSLARKNNFLPIYIRLNHDVKGTYSNQIIDKVKTAVKEVGGDIENFIQPIDENNCSLWEFFHGNEFWNKTNYPIVPLIVIDQFEEIFTLTKEKSTVNEFFIQLSDLCDNKMPQAVREYLNETNLRRDYSDKINYRLVLSLREDFLARLEEYAVNIPSLRRNRFSLQAINEEQAMEIIMKPSLGLVSEDVAIEIIRKVTNNAVFSIDGKPEITVETALLSLFCNELNNRRIEDGLSQITLELVEKFGDNIIVDFYTKTMSLIKEESMTYLESVLLTKKGFRDSIALGDALEFGVSEEEIDILQQNRLIHVDEWDGTKRIEFSHDVLCKVAKESRDKKEELNKLEIEKEINKKLEIEIRKGKKRKNTLLLCIIGLFLVIAGGVWWYFDAYVLEVEAFYGTNSKQFGWFVGQNELTKDEASHCKVYYRYSKKGSKSKHWTKMQAYDGYHHLSTDHSMVTYLINQFDDTDKGADEKMKEKLKSVCQWELISDATGEFVVEERGYDKDGKFIFSCKNTKLKNDREVMVSFFNEFGLPIIMRKDEANYVKITYDTKGNEVLYEYYDQDGYQQHNKDGAYKTEKRYDADGFQIWEASLNTLGLRMLDNAGNCGWKSRFKNGCSIWTCSFNEKGEPWPTSDGNVELRREYDKYGNITKQMNYNGYGKPSVDSAGVHIYIVKYNDHGKMILTECRDIHNRLCENANWKYVKVTRKYDSDGNLILEETFDKKNKCTYRLLQYYSDNILENKELYFLNETTDSLELNSRETFQKKKNTHSSWYPLSNYYNEWQIDSKGHMLYDVYYSSEKKTTPILGSSGYHLHKFVYDYKPNKTTISEVYYDNRGLLVSINESAKRSVLIDSINGTIIKALFDNQGKWIYTIKEQYDKKFTVKQSETSLGATGQPVRNNRIGPVYYKVMIEYTMNFDNFNAFVGQNEFGEPSLIEGGNGDGEPAVFHKLIYIKGASSPVYYDEKGMEIKDMKSYIKSIPRVVHIEIMDTIGNAYKCGIKDGDILIGFGNWKFLFENNFEKSYISLKDNFKRQVNNEKRIVVIRHYPKLNKSKVLLFDLPRGMMGISIRPIYYTQKEKERLMKYLN